MASCDHCPDDDGESYSWEVACDCCGARVCYRHGGEVVGGYRCFRCQENDVPSPSEIEAGRGPGADPGNVSTPPAVPPDPLAALAAQTAGSLLYEHHDEWPGLILDALRRAVAGEREACATVADNIASRRLSQAAAVCSSIDRVCGEQSAAVAAAIRARTG